MRRALKWGVVALVVVVLAVGGFLAWWILSDRAPGKPTLNGAGPTTGGPATPVGPWHVVRKKDAFVGYRIKELFGDAVLKHEVVGRTPTVSGGSWTGCRRWGRSSTMSLTRRSRRSTSSSPS